MKSSTYVNHGNDETHKQTYMAKTVRISSRNHKNINCYTDLNKPEINKLLKKQGLW